MKRAYLCSEDTDGWVKSNEPYIDAGHPDGLPGLDCPIEGPWATEGLSFPTVKKEAVERLAGRLEPWPISIDKFEKLSSDLKSVFPNQSWIIPGAEFGPLEGTATGGIGDFGWGLWGMVVREHVLNEILSAGFKVRAEKAKLKFNLASHEPLYELEIWPTALATKLTDDLPCELCGRTWSSVPDQLIIDEKSLRSFPALTESLSAANPDYRK